jgi:hypothetical protein
METWGCRACGFEHDDEETDCPRWPHDDEESS